MKTPGRKLAEWVVNDPKRVTYTPRTDLAFYTVLYNLAALLIVIAVLIGLAASI